MYKSENLGLNLTEMDKDGNHYFNFDTDLNQNFLAIDNLALSQRHITNCITKKPQDIKLELNNGVITLKKGSMVYFPNGANVFEKKVTQNDISLQSAVGNPGRRLLTLDGSLQGFNWYLIEECISSTTEPDSFGLWWDLTNNIIYKGADSYTQSLPLAIFSNDENNNITIEQVFNNCGIFGKTIYALPGIEGLVSNGWLADGSSQNIVQKLNKVVTYTFNSTYFNGDYVTSLIDDDGNGLTGMELKAAHSIIYSNEEPTDINKWWFHIEANQWKYANSASTGTTKRWWLDFGVVNVANGVIQSFTPKTTFNAVDFNDYNRKITELETKIAALEAAIAALSA